MGKVLNRPCVPYWWWPGRFRDGYIDDMCSNCGERGGYHKAYRSPMDEIQTIECDNCGEISSVSSLWLDQSVREDETQASESIRRASVLRELALWGFDILGMLMELTNENQRSNGDSVGEHR
ncbi:MAG: hypothetical protein ACXABN_16970 [Candidatus Thorarchaeota archaeon]|jgi:hypothetical protein